MNWHKTTLEISTHGKGLYDITETVRAQLRDWNVRKGCVLYSSLTPARHW